MTKESKAAKPEESVKSMYDLFGTDSDKETAGIDLSYGPAGDVRIARAGGSNKLYTRAMERIFRPHRRSVETNTIDPDFMDTLFKKVYAESVVLSWKGIKGRDGKDLAFTPANVEQLFDDLPEFWVEIRTQATSSANFQEDDTEGDVKN